jgi:two-component system, OmpR family, response regulator
MTSHTLHSRSNATKKNILVVEDEGEMCLLLNVILDDDSMEMQHVNTLLGASEILDSKKPDVVLLDNRLPDGYGFDFIRHINNTCPNTKVIMMSGVDIAAGDSALEAGADAFLAKPFNRSTLKAVINQVLHTG